MRSGSKVGRLNPSRHGNVTRGKDKATKDGSVMTSDWRTEDEKVSRRRRAEQALERSPRLGQPGQVMPDVRKARDHEAWALRPAAQRRVLLSPSPPPTTPKFSCVENFFEYTRNSSMHGLKYIGDESLTAFERFFWAVMFILAVFGAAYFINQLFSKFRDMPVIMSLSPSTVDLSTIPFPAITICNMNNARRSNAERILAAANAKSGPDLERKLLNDFCGNEPQPQDAPLEEQSNWTEVQAFMVKVLQPCHEMFVNCMWEGGDINCNSIINPRLTDEGMCCVFNSLKRDYIFSNPRNLTDLNVTYDHDSVDWTPENGYPEETPVKFLPWRPTGAGRHIGLSVVIDAELNEYYCSSENSVGFKVVLHNPIETPKITAFGAAISPGQETRFVIMPQITYSSSALEAIDLDKRLCFFTKERQLKFYRTYTQRNCNLECEANFTLAFCNCVLYYLPKDKDIRICGGGRDAVCARRAQSEMEKSLRDNSGHNHTVVGLNVTVTPCRCLPGCNEIGYSGVQSSSSLTSNISIPEKFLKGKSKEYFKENMAVIHFFFVQKQFTATDRGVLYGFTEFLSNTGGLLGLFLGFSFLSAVEIVYYMSLRVWCAVRQKSEEEEVFREQELTKYNKPLPFTK